MDEKALLTVLVMSVIGALAFFLKAFHSSIMETKTKVAALEIKSAKIQGALDVHTTKIVEIERKTAIYDMNIESFWKEFDNRIRTIFTEEFSKRVGS